MPNNETPDNPDKVHNSVKGKGLPNPEDAIGRRIREKREEHLLNVSQLSERTKALSSDGKGLSRAVIAGYENGEYKPGTRELRLLCDALVVSPTWLIYGNEQVSKQHPTIKRVKIAETSELAAAKLMYVITSLPEQEFEAVATLLLSLAKKDKVLMRALSDDVEVIGRMLDVNSSLEYSPQWSKHQDKQYKKLYKK